MIGFMKDKEETAQWVANPATIRSILESMLSRVSSLKRGALLVHHKTCYDGIFEKAWASKSFQKQHIYLRFKYLRTTFPEVLIDMMTEFQSDMHLACYSEMESPSIYTYATTGVKEKLLQAKM